MFYILKNGELYSTESYISFEDAFYHLPCESVDEANKKGFSVAMADVNHDYGEIEEIYSEATADEYSYLIE